MKRYINCGIAMLAIAAASVTVSCSKEEAYDTAVMRDLQMTLDGEPWSPYYGTDNKVDPYQQQPPYIRIPYRRLLLPQHAVVLPILA